MLEPSKRQVYLEALRPPTGYRLDRAVGTTYSLDLLALLVTPVSFALFDFDGWEEALRDPLALVQALRRSAARMSLFCQEGKIHVPQYHHFLFSELEEMVVQVRAPASEGVFHPKTWTLRYVDDQGQVRYRFLCLSRNLTFDRSWDLVFAVEGPVAEGPTTVDAGPIGDFLVALPGLAVGSGVPARVAADVDLMQDEIRRVDLRASADAGFDPGSLRFVPLGIEGYGEWPFGRSADRALVVSPFLSLGPLRLLTATGSRHVLVSRAESIDAIGDEIQERFDEILILDEAAGEDADNAATGESASDAPAPTAGDPSGEARPPELAEPAHQGRDETRGEEDPAERERRGLHAKLFIAEEGGGARWWVGSANATAAALPLTAGPAGRNVEFLVELRGPVRRVGIDAVLQSAEGRTGLRDLLVPWHRPAEEVPPDPLRAELDERLAQCARGLAAAGAGLRAEPVDNDLFDLILSWDGAAATAEGGLTAVCWPVTLPQAVARSYDPSEPRGEIRFSGLTAIGLSSFMAFELQAARGGVTRHLRFVLKLPLEGAPDDRAARVLHHVLSDRATFLRYLLMLLAEEGLGGSGRVPILPGASGGGGRDGARALLGIPLLEELVRAVARHPERIGQVKRIVDDLRRTPQGREVLPEGFDAVWQPIEAMWKAGGGR